METVSRQMGRFPFLKNGTEPGFLFPGDTIFWLAGTNGTPL